MAATKNKAKLSWHDKAHQLADSLCKKAKIKKSSLLVFTKPGDLVLQCGKSDKFDPTAIGALITAAHGLRRELDQLLDVKTKRLLCTDDEKHYWLEEIGTWVVLGVHINESAALKDFFKHLKKKSAQEGSAAEALDGLSPDAVDFAIENRSN